MDMTKMTQKSYFDSSSFQEGYHCDAPLGVFLCPQGTRFHLWAPTAQNVTLRLYQAGSGGDPLEQIPLTQGAQGLWTYETEANLNGVYYDYLVTVDEVTRSTADPYARACGINGERSMVLDLSATDPEGWPEDKAPPLPPETVIYEMHIKDFSWDPASGVPAAYRGKFKALCQDHTTLNGDGVHATCLSYLKELGVTHVQLMPVYDFGSVDESGDPEQFNWGYDPVNYNVPEGSYSTDPSNGAVRIREMKEAIQALHNNGLRVIMDVVYNHTYRLDSWLWRTVPWYYYRQRPDGSPSDGSGCGNDLASERSMCAKYILDSVLYWAEEYHIDGFRFDLMGLLDVPLMNRIRQELDQRWGRGEKLMLGEPWAANSTAARPGTVLVSKGRMAELDKQISVFCDNTRDAMKGNLQKQDARGFVNGGGLNADLLACCVKGWSNCQDGFAKAPSQVVNYLSAHDDWTLWDRLVYTGDEQLRFQMCHSELLRQNRLAAAINFSCQGQLFLLSGEEFARTKQGIQNSYRSPLETNQLDWSRAWINHDLVEYYKGLIALRMHLPGLQDKTPQAAERILSVAAPAENCAVIQLCNDGGNSPWKKLYLAYNASHVAVPLALPQGEWEVLVNADSSFEWQHPQRVMGTAVLAPLSVLFLGSSE